MVMILYVTNRGRKIVKQKVPLMKFPQQVSHITAPLLKINQSLTYGL